MNASPSFRRLGQIAQPVQDLRRATAFYEEVLGPELLFEVPRMAFFGLEGLRLMLAQPEGGTPGTGSFLYFSVTDLESAHRVLAERGVEFDQDPTLVAHVGDHDLWMAFFRDTEGNPLALMAEVPVGGGASPGLPGPAGA